MAGRTLFFACYAILASLLLSCNFVIVPVAIQAVLYTFATIYIGSHLSLKMNEVDGTTGEKTYQTETVTRKDAMMFPLIGSAALLTLYIVYKFLPPYWVNLLLATYLTAIGGVAVAETILVCMEALTPSSFDAMIFSKQFQLPWKLANPDGPYDITASGNQVLCYCLSFVTAVLWLVTKHWALHNVLAVGFCVQAIRLISVGSFSIASILMCGLFVYDIFWVFGTEVMVTVAKSFEGPAKIIFPTQFSPWNQSILGLGDVVIPGILIAMILRFDNWLRTPPAKRTVKKKTSPTEAVEVPKETTGAKGGNALLCQENVDIHERFPKRYFLCNLLAYEAGLLTTLAIMFGFNSPQPALLYLVPFCLLGLYVPAWYWGELKQVIEYSEEEEEAPPATNELVAAAAAAEGTNGDMAKQAATPSDESLRKRQTESKGEPVVVD